jgi:hypothetical protein
VDDGEEPDSKKPGPADERTEWNVSIEFTKGRCDIIDASAAMAARVVSKRKSTISLPRHVPRRRDRPRGPDDPA